MFEYADTFIEKFALQHRHQKLAILLVRKSYNWGKQQIPLNNKTWLIANWLGVDVMLSNT